MAIVDEPDFGYKRGKVRTCDQCPLDELISCIPWLCDHDNLCPTRETYQEAVELAEKEAQQ